MSTYGAIYIVLNTRMLLSSLYESHPEWVWCLCGPWTCNRGQVVIFMKFGQFEVAQNSSQEEIQ